MKLPFHTYDVFTNERFGGNPLAIVEEADGLTTAEMQIIAREFNLSETIFVLKPRDPRLAAPSRPPFGWRRWQASCPSRSRASATCRAPSSPPR